VDRGISVVPRDPIPHSSRHSTCESVTDTGGERRLSVKCAGFFGERLV
jgi:hypothetical protein